MAITTVIMIILSIAVLTILVVFFNSQTGFLSKWFKTQSTESNVDLVISSCDGLVATRAVYAYCCEVKEINFGGKKEIKKMKCVEIAEAEWSGGRVEKMDCPANVCAG